MKNKKYTVNIYTGEGLSELIEATERYEKWLQEKSKMLLQRLTDEGLRISTAGFQSASYDGTNDVSVSVESRGEKTRAIVARGATVLFIEFGTGVTYPDDHPEKPAGVQGRGTYGHKLGRLEGGWRYPESHGAGTSATQDPKHPGFLHTYGNPANKPMYETKKELREKLTQIAKEVFSD